jgi:hypothetical protein
MPEQLQLFASLDFPGRSTLMLWEIADRLGVSVRHLLNEVDCGSLVVLDLKAKNSNRRAARVPVETYRAYILQRLTGPADVRMQFLKDLPKPLRLQIIADLKASL